MKDVQTGTKCPEEMEDLVRAMVVKECLDKVGCTYDQMKEVSKIAQRERTVSEDIFADIDGAVSDP